MRRVWVVVRREYLERVRSKGFVLGTVALPLIMVFLMGAGAYLGARGGKAQRELALVDLSGFLANGVRERLEGAGYGIEIMGRDSPPALHARVENDELYGYLVLDDLTIEEGITTFIGRKPPGVLAAGLIRSMVVQAVLDVRLNSAEGPTTDVSALLSGGALDFEAVGSAADPDQRAAVAIGFLGAMLLYVSMVVYGNYVLRSVLEEKRSRIVEVVISSLRPWQLMLGKIIGVGAVGLTQMAIWAGFLLLVATQALPGLVARWPDLEGASDMANNLPGVGTALLFLVFFTLGYFLYSSLFAAVGAICTRDEEAQQAQFPIVMLLVFPLIMQVSTMDGPALKWLDWAALFPFFSPVLMFPRAVAGSVPAWMVALSIVFMVVALAGTAWVAGRVYRVGILMQGKRPSLPEILRWVREA